MFLNRADEAHSLCSWRIYNLSFARDKWCFEREGRRSKLRDCLRASQKSAQQALHLAKVGLITEVRERGADTPTPAASVSSRRSKTGSVNTGAGNHGYLQLGGFKRSNNLQVGPVL